jgi:DNA-binding beta-propeller fold protein YncE
MSDRRTTLLALAGSLGFGLTGCGNAPAPLAVPDRLTWPTPPEQPRYLYEGTLRNAASLRDRSALSEYRRLLTGEDESRVSFGKPLAVAAFRGRVYVTDTEGRRVFVFDLPRRRAFSFGLRFEGELKKPSGIAVDSHGQVYVVDSTARRLVIFDALGLYLRHIDGAQTWARPTAVAVSRWGERVYVVDTGGVDSDSHRIWVHGADGKALGPIGARGNGPGQFNLPTDADVAPDGSLYVLDAGNFRVQCFGADGVFRLQFGSVGNAVGQFARPRGLAVDGDGLVYVSDASFCNVQVFSAEGQMLLTIGSRAERDAPGRYMLPAKVAADESGRLYIVDQFLHKIDIIRRLSDSEGQQMMG